MRHHSTWKWRC